MTVEIDQSGKLEQLNTNTAIAYSNGESGAIWLTAGTKRKILLFIQKTLIPSHDQWAIIFAITIYSLIKNINNNAIIYIDEEYTGKDKIIEEILTKLLNESKNKKWNGSIRFARIGKSSNAHKLCWKVHRNKNRDKYRSIKTREILAILEKH